MEYKFDDSVALKLVNDSSNILSTGSVKAQIRFGEADVKLEIMPIIVHDRSSLIDVLRSVKHQMNERLTELVNQQKTAGNCKNQLPSQTEDNEDHESGHEGLFF